MGTVYLLVEYICDKFSSICVNNYARNKILKKVQVFFASEAERSEASSQSKPRFAKARELLFNVWGLEQAVSRKLSIFDIWCIEEKVFVFT